MHAPQLSGLLSVSPHVEGELPSDDPESPLDDDEDDDEDDEEEVEEEDASGVAALSPSVDPVTENPHATPAIGPSAKAKMTIVLVACPPRRIIIGLAGSDFSRL